MITVLDLAAQFDYIVKSDLKSKVPTKFKLGIIDNATMARLKDGQTRYILNDKSKDGNSDMTINRHQHNVEVVRHGLRGWENLSDGKGQVSFKKGEDGLVTDDVMKVLPLNVVEEIAEEIIRLNSFSGDESKN